MKTSRIILLLMVGLAMSHWTRAQAEFDEGAFVKDTGRKLGHKEWMANLPEKFDLFAGESALQIALETDFKQFNKDKFKGNKQDALIHFPLNDSLVIKRIIRIEPRGEFRRKYCNPPPIKLNFKKTEIYADKVQDLDKMKMVSSCKSTRVNEEYVLKEYLVYKMYNLFTDLSFKARLLEVKFIDTGWKKPKTSTSYAFLIEEVDDISKRHDYIELEVQTATMKSVIDQEMAMVAMFNYMIGNTDWSITGLHNVKLFRDEDAMQTKAHIVPYDFDYCGVVNATYAIPSTNFNLSNVRERLFRSECYSEELFEQTIDRFKAQKAQVFEVINEFPHLSEAVKKDVSTYIREFYDQIESPGAVAFFRANCGKFL